MYDEGFEYPGRSFRGGRGGHRHGGRSGFRGGPSGGPWSSSRTALDEDTAELRQALLATVAAARQVAANGDPAAAAKAAELLNGARKGLYRLLAGDAE